MRDPKKTGIIAGTLILSASSISVRMIGFLFRIYLAGAIGAQGMGLYTLIMSLYALGATVSTSGVGLAVSKLAAEEFARGNTPNARRVLRRALGLTLSLSLVVSFVMFFFSDFIALNILKDARAAFPLRLLAPGMPLLAVSACFRGYFIAERSMFNPASGQLLEQLFKMAFIMLILGRWLPLGVEYGCAAIVLGITFGEIVCFAYTLSGYYFEKRRGYSPRKITIKKTMKKILEITIPVSLSSYVRSALRLVEDVLILAGLNAFLGADSAALETYGRVKGMVIPLLIFPLSLLSAFVVTLTPEISRLGAHNEHLRLERVISKILHVTCIAGIFIVSIFMTFSYELGVVIYNDGGTGEMLRRMAFLCPFMCVETVVISILQGLGQQKAVMRYSLADCLLRVAMVYFLVPRSGVNGFILMVIISNLFTSILSLYRLFKISKISLRVNDWLIKPALAAASASQIVKAICNFYLFDALPDLHGLALGLFFIALIYTAVLFSVGSISPGDFAWIPEKLHPRPPVTGTEST